MRKLDSKMRKEVHDEQMTNLLIRDKFNQLRRQLAQMRLVMLLIIAAVALDVMMDVFKLW